MRRLVLIALPLVAALGCKHAPTATASPADLQVVTCEVIEADGGASLQCSP